MTAENFFRGSLFTNDFLQESISRVADWQALTDAELDLLSTDLLAVFAAFPIAGRPNESQTEDDLI